MIVCGTPSTAEVRDEMTEDSPSGELSRAYTLCVLREHALRQAFQYLLLDIEINCFKGSWA